MTPEKAAQIILDTIQLDAEQFRMGKTKVQSQFTLIDNLRYDFWIFFLKNCFVKVVVLFARNLSMLAMINLFKS